MSWAVAILSTLTFPLYYCAICLCDDRARQRPHRAHSGIRFSVSSTIFPALVLGLLFTGAALSLLNVSTAQCVRHDGVTDHRLQEQASTLLSLSSSQARKHRLLKNAALHDGRTAIGRCAQVHDDDNNDIAPRRSVVALRALFPLVSGFFGVRCAQKWRTLPTLG